MAVLDILTYLAIGSTVVPISLILFRYKRQPIEYKWLAFILLFSFFSDVAAELFYQFHLGNNIANNFYSTLSPIFTSIFFYLVIKSPKLKVPLIIFCFLYVLSSLYNIAFIQKTSLVTYNVILEKLLIMVLSVIYFFKILRELPEANIYHIGLFWIVSALFITTSAKLVVFSVVTYLISIFQDNLIFLWCIHNTLSIICYLTIAWGIWIHNKRNLKRLENPKLVASE